MWLWIYKSFSQRLRILFSDYVHGATMNAVAEIQKKQFNALFFSPNGVGMKREGGQTRWLLMRWNCFQLVRDKWFTFCWSSAMQSATVHFQWEQVGCNALDLCTQSVLQITSFPCGLKYGASGMVSMLLFGAQLHKSTNKFFVEMHLIKKWSERAGIRQVIDDQGKN